MQENRICIFLNIAVPHTAYFYLKPSICAYQIHTNVRRLTKITFCIQHSHHIFLHN